MYEVPILILGVFRHKNKINTDVRDNNVRLSFLIFIIPVFVFNGVDERCPL